MSDDEYDGSVDGELPPSIDPYETLDLERDATAEQVKSAYRKAALKSHPDKVPENKKQAAHEAFQAIAFAYAILSEPSRRKRYDATGSTAESIVDAEGFNWSDFYREQFENAISSDAIEKFSNKYKGSDEEKDDLLIAYEQGEGDMDMIYETVMLSNVIEDDARFRRIIDAAIENNDVPRFPAYVKESKKKQESRMKKARAEAGEAEEYAKEIGVHDKLFRDKKKGKKGKDDESDLAALILKRQQDRSSDNFLDRLADKYATPAAKGKKGGKRGRAEEEPSEEAFQAAAARLNPKAKKSRG